MIWIMRVGGGHDSNLRPTAPKALNSQSSAQGFKAISDFYLVLRSLS